MRFAKKIAAGLTMALLVGTGAFASTDLNEVGAFLVFPIIVASPNQANFPAGVTETYVTITNAGPDAIDVHLSMINGQQFLPGGGPDQDENPNYCYECDVNIFMSPADTETLVLTNIVGGGTRLLSLDGTVDLSCQIPYGMLVASIEDFNGNTVTDNVLLGSEVFVSYTAGVAFSIPAIPFQGMGGNDGNREYGFDDVEYGALPRIVATDFIAPNLGGGITANLALFTLGFDRQHPPETDCSVTGFDAFENPFSNSFIFGCWTLVDLIDIQTEFAYPNLGQFGQLDEHGWLQLNCRVDRDDNGTWDAMGGVHGALVQTITPGNPIRRNAPAGPGVANPAAWARLLYQSVTTGDAVTLHLESAPGGLN